MATKIEVARDVLVAALESKQLSLAGGSTEDKAAELGRALRAMVAEIEPVGGSANRQPLPPPTRASETGADFDPYADR